MKDLIKKTFLILTAAFFLLASTQDFLSLAGKWKFKPDPQKIGVEKGWFALQFDDSGWKEIATGRSWESQGYDMDGEAWFRRWFVLPASWKGKKIYFGADSVDDSYELYLNGKKVVSFIEKEKSTYRNPTCIDITAYLKPGKNLIALRVVDYGGAGGITGSKIGLALNPLHFKDRREILRQLYRLHPYWPLPYWAKGKPIAWIMLGNPNAKEEALRSIDGSLGATSLPFTVSFWLVDDEGNVVAGENAEFSRQIKSRLLQGWMPYSIYTVDGEKCSLQSEAFVMPEKDYRKNSVLMVRVRPVNCRGGSYRLYIAVRPHLVNSRAGHIESIKLAGKQVLVNGKHRIVFERTPDRFFVEEGKGERDIAGLLYNQAGKEESSVSSRFGLASAAAEFHVKCNQSLELFIPLDESFAEVSFTEAADRFIAYWRKLFARLRFSIPDKRIERAFHASLAYILISMDHFMPHPGPLAYDFFWYRDSAYITQALLRAGFFEEVKRSLVYFMKAQKESGEFPSIFDINLKPVGPHEWDAQGQALFALAEYLHFTGDRPFVSKFRSNVEKAVSFLIKLRQQNLKPQLRDTPLYGILPPSVSAEDLGSGKWHHYWDDFWAVIGFEKAAYIMEQLGQKRKAEKYRKEAERLLNAVVCSAEMLKQKHGIDWFPNGPEDLYGSSMARGTSPAIWPGQLFDPDDPLIQSSFAAYYRFWIEPFAGAYLHQGRFWPYGLELAYCYVLLGRKDIAERILYWHLDHQTYPENYAWGEQLNPADATFRSGDIPHCWVAADFINLVRGMILHEKDDQLLIFPGVPDWWFEKGGFDIELPTHFGPLTLKALYHRGTDLLELSVKGASKASKVKIFLPFKAPSRIKATCRTKLQGRVLEIEPDCGRILVFYQ